MTRPGAVLFSRPAIAALVVIALGVVFEFVPGLDVLGLFGPRRTGSLPTPASPSAPLELGEAEIEQETRTRTELTQPERVQPSSARRGPIAAPRGDEAPLPGVNADEPPIALLDPSGRALHGFYAALGRTAQKQPGAITRIVHFGDSIIVGDYVSGTLRRKLQGQFGDAGHGFLLLANAWPGYSHNDVYRSASSGWLVSRIVGPLAADGLYGLGGVSFRAPPGARAWFGTAKKGSFGRAVSRFGLIYLAQPTGGQVHINVDGKQHSVIDTLSPTVRVGVHEAKVPDGEHEFELVTKGNFRGFGVTLERESPGVVLDAIGIQGARIRFLDKQDDAHWAEQLRLRNSNLLIYQFGANESSDGFAYPMQDYLRTMKDVLRQGRQALPDAGCLVFGAMDRATKRGTVLVSMDVIPAIVKEQKRAAAEEGCAYFDTFEAMGGTGSMAKWVRRGLGQADLTHPSGWGSEVLANWIYRALMQGYGEYAAKRH